MSGVKRESKEPRTLEQLLAVLKYGPVTSEQLRIRLRNDSTPKGVSAAIQVARIRGLIERRPEEGWALTSGASK